MDLDKIRKDINEVKYMKISKKGMLMLAACLLAVGFASVSTTLILTGTVSVGVNKDDFEVVFASANIDGGHANISKTNKKGDTLTFSTPDIVKVDEPVVLNYTVKNNSTQYGADVSIKCYAVDDTNHYLNDYITLTGVFGTQNITFGVDEASATLSEAETINAQGVISGSITVNLDKPFLGIDGKLSVACKIVANASEQTSAGVRPANTLASNTEIESITANNKPFTKVTGKDYDYELLMSEAINEMVLDVKTKNLYSEVYIGKTEEASTLNSEVNDYKVSPLGVSLLTGSNIEYTKNLTIQVESGANYYKIKIISEDGTQEKVYTIKILFLEPLVGFAKKIVESNVLITKAPTLTTTSYAAKENGFYMSTDTNSGEPTYYFRGTVTNNYVDFAGYTWRIIRVNEDGTIRLVTQSRLGNFMKFTNNSGTSYQYAYYSNGSLPKSYLTSWYKTNITDKGLDDYVATGDYFCEQAKAGSYEKNLSYGSETLPFITSYTPTFMCSTDVYGYGLYNSNVGLINVDELFYAGAYYAIPNSSFYLYNGKSFGTMSPAGVYDKDGRFGVYCMVNGNYIVKDPINNDAFGVRAVINLNPDIIVTGTGTSGDPYVVQ